LIRRLRVGGAVALAALLGSCEPSVSGGRIVIGESADIGVLLPAIETSALDGEVNSLLYPGLNSARWENGALEYLIDERSLAERWAFSADSLALTYTLRRDAVWSDGQPIDGHDVVFTYELVRRPEIASIYADVWEHLDSVVAPVDHEVAFYFQRRYPGMLFDTGIGIIPAHVYEDAAADDATLASHPGLVDPGGNLVVGGPYRVAEWRHGDRLVLEANPTAFSGRPRTDTVVFLMIPEETTRLIGLENGLIDVTGPLSMARAEELDANPRFRIESVSDRFYDYVAWNGARFDAFADPELRYALSLAIDRQAILEALGMARYARPATGPYPSIFRRVADPELTADSYLPDSARAILAAKGWRDSDGDGVLDRDGRPFRFTLLTQAGNGRRTSAAEIIQAQYARIGIDMEVRVLEFNALLGLIFDERDFEAVLMGWQVALEPDYVAWHFWPADNVYNFTGYQSAALDSLIPLADASATAEAAAPYWRAAARAIAADRPYAFLWFFDDAVAVNERVQDTRIDTYGLYQNLHRWRLTRQ
jgi:peptide/nickel transport system substrate-binding protein